MTETLDFLLPSHEAAAKELRASLSGGVVLPADERYRDARRVWNGAVRHRPAMIAFCHGTADVQTALRTARRHSLPLSVRGGGHDWAGRALRDGGLVLDLTGMRGVAVDPRAQVATVAGGATVKDVAQAATPHGLIAALGNCGAVGMAGFTLGGGYSPLSGLYGLAADNLLGAEVVLADGQRVWTDAQEEPELFWALRGGGGNFGVVTAMRVRLHGVRTMLSGPIVFPWDEAETVLRRYARFIASMPDELGTPIIMTSGPDGDPVLVLQPLWNGERDRGERAMADLRALGTPRLAAVGPATYADMLARLEQQQADDGRHWEVRARWLPEIAPGAIAAMAAGFSRRTSRHSMVVVDPVHGAATRVAPDATAFGLRRPHVLVEAIAGWEPGEDGAAQRRWAEELWHDLAPFALPGGYANVLGPDNHEQAAHAYGGNGCRLRAAKRHYDPGNVFASAIPLPES